MSYAYVEDNEIKKITDILPRNWKNISGLHLSVDNQEFLKSVGWYRIVRAHVSFDEETQKISSYEYLIEADYVNEIPQVIDKPESEIVTFFMKKEAFVVNLRSMRDNLLKESDWTQFPDVVEIKSEEFTYRWKQYRQSLRDITEEYKNNNIIDLESVVWPLAPVTFS